MQFAAELNHIPDSHQVLSGAIRAKHSLSLIEDTWALYPINAGLQGHVIVGQSVGWDASNMDRGVGSVPQMIAVQTN